MIYPQVTQQPIILRAASSVNALDEPISNIIASGGGYSQALGFNGVPVNVRIELLEDADADDSVAIETCTEQTFTVPTTHPDSPVVISDLNTGQVTEFGLQGGLGFFRFVNNSSADVEISVWYLPNRN